MLKKWLSYQEYELLGPALTLGDARYVTAVARRIAALLLLEPKLDANYRDVAADAYPRPRGRSRRRRSDPRLRRPWLFLGVGWFTTPLSPSQGGFAYKVTPAQKVPVITHERTLFHSACCATPKYGGPPTIRHKIWLKSPIYWIMIAKN